MRKIKFNRGTRFSQPAIETLISWINVKNNRRFSPSQFEFGTPVPVSNDGTVDIPFTYTDTGDSDTLRVQRVNLSRVPGLHPIVLHSVNLSTDSILKALLDQYGLYLDEDMVEVRFDTNINEMFPTELLEGFSQNDTDSDDVGADYRGSECTIRILDHHLVYEGELKVLVRKSMLSNGNTIDRIINLRKFYESHDEVPFIETYQPGGLWTVDGFDHETRRRIEYCLHYIQDSGPVDYDLLADILHRITKDDWVSNEETQSFNIQGAKVIYNGLSSEYPGIGPLTHSHLLILELSKLCDNLQGHIHIAYRYSPPHHPFWDLGKR